jgi:radical SAM superfamily enzyme YgiQ (UPF0313 family)
MNALLVAKHSNIEPLGLMTLCSELKKDKQEVSYLLLKTGDEEIKPQYDLVGFSTYTGYHKQMFAKALSLEGKVKRVIGGPHATYFSEECKQFSDHVVVGEGLRAIKEICLGESLPKVIFYPQLTPEAFLPTPDRDWIYRDYPEYKLSKIKSVMSSYGCPYACTYCFNDSLRKLYPGYRVRYREVDSVISECKSLKQYGTELIFFQDDCFGFDLKWLVDFAFKYEAQVKIPFHCQVRPEMVNWERLRFLKLAGCHGVTLAIETFSDRVRNEVLNRHTTNEVIYDTCSMIKDFGFKLRTEQMLGVPQTTLEEEIELLKMNIKIKPDIAWTSIFSPYLGTTLGDYCKNTKLYSGNNDDLGESFFLPSKLNFSSDRLRKTNLLHFVFSTCAKIPNGEKLAERFLFTEGSFSSWFSCMREHLYQTCLYNTSKEMNI